MPFDCQITLDPQGLDKVTTYLEKLPKNYQSVAIISDEHVYRLYGEKVRAQLETCHIRTEPILLSPGESSKTIEKATYCWESLLNKKMDRGTLILALGGGVVSDVGGFVASTYMRGLDLVNVPTTLEGMVDAAIGGKNGLNLKDGKNIIGTFYHPKLILIDVRCLQTLPPSEINAGLSEVIKYGIIADAGLFDYLEDNIEEIRQLEPGKLETVIARSCEIKSKIVMQDGEDKKGLRAILNYGHTFAHAIESGTGYQKILHGEAVAIGMSCAAYLSYCLGYVDHHFIDRQENLCRRAGLSTALPEIPTEKLLSLMAQDKKVIGGRNCFVVAHGIGSASQKENIDKEIILQSLEMKKSREKGQAC